MGCYFRPAEDWEKDFWNNDKEFPNDNSVNSQNRLNAYKFLLSYIEINYKKP